MSKITDVITKRVRPLLDDTDTLPANQDWLDAQLLYWYTDALNAIRGLRSDAFINATGDEIVLTTPIDVSEDRILDDRWMNAEAEYIAFMAFSEDAGDQRDEKRSQEHLASFNRLIKTL